MNWSARSLLPLPSPFSQADTSNNAIRVLKLRNLAVAPSSYVVLQTIFSTQGGRGV